MFHVYPSAIGSAIARGSHRVKVWVMVSVSVRVGAATEYILRVTVLLTNGVINRSDRGLS